MDYTYTELTETSAYTLTINTDENIFNIINNDNFEIGIYDQVSNQNITINKNNFQNYGLNNHSSNLDDRLELSLFDNKGLVVYCNTDNSLIIKQLIVCNNGTEYIGFNSSSITIWFNENDKLSCNSCLLPKLIRADEILQNSLTEPDPVLAESNKRQMFDYDMNKKVPGVLVQDIDHNYTCGDGDSIYVNTNTSVPLYTSVVSAFTRSTHQDSTFNFNEITSFLYDDENGTHIDIPYETYGPFITRLDLGQNYTAELEYYTYIQQLSASNDSFNKNKLFLSLSTSALAELDPLSQLIITTSNYQPANRELSLNTGDGKMNVEIINTNAAFLTYEPVVSILGNVGGEIDQNTKTFDPLTGRLTFTIKNITTTSTGNIQIAAYLNVTDCQERSPEAIRYQTLGYSSPIEWVYKKEQIKQLSLVITEKTPSNLILNRNNPTGEIKGYIQNSNARYLAVEPIIIYTGNGTLTGKLNPATGRYDFTISGITTKSMISTQITAYLQAVSPDWTPIDIRTKTTVSSPIITWTYQQEELLPLQLTILGVTPSNYILNKTNPTGTITAEIINPNVSYLAIKPTISILENTTATIKVDKFDPSTGKTTITVSNISQGNATIYAYINSTSPDFSPSEIKQKTEVYSNTFVWSYIKEIFSPLIIQIKQTIPDNCCLNKNTPNGTIIAEIFNPNNDYVNVKPNVTILGTSGGTITSEDFNPTSGRYTITITGNTANLQSETKIQAWLTISDHVDWTADQIKTFTNAFSDNINWNYTKEILNHLQINILSVEPETQQLDKSHKNGTIFGQVINTNEDYYNITPYLKLADNSLGTITLSDYDPETGILLFEVTQINTKTEGFVQLYACLNDATTDYSKTEVIEQTEVTSQKINWAYNKEVLDPIVIEYSEYIPEGDETNTHWVTFDEDGMLTSGGVNVTITNPNTDYIGSDYPLVIDYTLPVGAISSNIDDSLYAADGTLKFNIWNISAGKTETTSAIQLDITAFGNFESSDYNTDEIKTITSAHEKSEWWKYKKVIPDIGPYDFLRNYNLYSLSDLTILGGYLGGTKRKMACKNLELMNKGYVDLDMDLAAGCSFVSRGGTVNGTLRAESVTCYNPTSFTTVYAENTIYLDGGTIIPTAVTGANCQCTFINGSKIENYSAWENPEYPILTPIPTQAVIVTGTNIATNGDVLGSPNDQGTKVHAFDSLVINNEGTKEITFYPGTYHFKRADVETDTIMYIHNKPSTDTYDGSVMIYIDEVGEFKNNIKFIQDSAGIYDFRIYYNGTKTLCIGVAGKSEQAGTIIAPNGTIELQNDAYWIGNIWANKVVLGQNAELHSR